MRETWGSRLGFVMATAGFSIGLGNIWRFSYQAGSNGGGAFLLLYVVFAILIGIPLFTAEITLGRKTQLTPIAGMRDLVGLKSPWSAIAWLGVASSILIMTYYPMLIGWVIGYIVMIARGQLGGLPTEAYASTFEEFRSNSALVLAYTVAALAAAGAIVATGLQKGIERVAKIALPMLFVLLLVLIVRSVTFSGATEGLAWYLKPDFTKINGTVALAALGQAFYSIGIGMAVAFAFGSYLPKGESDIPGNVSLIVAFDTLAAVLAGFVIFPALFAFGLAPDSGPGLLFVTMANLFGRMPAGALFGVVFFILVLLAGLTSVVATLEVLGATLTDLFGISRRKAVWWTTAVLILLGVPVILSQQTGSGLVLFGSDLFTLADTFIGSVLLPVGALALAAYTAWVWRFDQFRDDANAGSGRVKVFESWRPFVSFLIPVAVALILLGGLGILG